MAQIQNIDLVRRPHRLGGILANDQREEIFSPQFSDESFILQTLSVEMRKAIGDRPENNFFCHSHSGERGFVFSQGGIFSIQGFPQCLPGPHCDTHDRNESPQLCIGENPAE